MNIIGLDIGGSKIEGILWDGRKVVRAEKIKTPRNRWTFLREVVGLVNRIGHSSQIRGVGVALAGAIDRKRGLSMRSPNLRFIESFPLKKYLQKKLRKTVRLENDAKSFLRAELKYGAGRGKRNVIALTIGTGIGGGIFSEGKIVYGKHGAAAELGHMVVARERKGKEVFTVESFVSGHGFRRLGFADPLKYQHLAEAGDKKSIALYAKIGGYLGIALASLVNIFDPEIIILGGGIARAKSILVKPAKKEMQKHTVLPPGKLPPIVVTKLKHAGALGAVCLFLDNKKALF